MVVQICGIVVLRLLLFFLVGEGAVPVVTVVVLVMLLVIACRAWMVQIVIVILVFGIVYHGVVGASGRDWRGGRIRRLVVRRGRVGGNATVPIVNGGRAVDRRRSIS